MPICIPFNANFFEYFKPQRSMFETNPETCFVHDLCPPFDSPTIMSICNPFSFNFPEYFIPQRSMFQTNPETCFVHGLCPPTTTSLFPRIISICNPFNLNLPNISSHNEACFRLTLKHASYTTSVHPWNNPPFPHQYNAHLHPLQRQFAWIFQTTTKHVWD